MKRFPLALGLSVSFVVAPPATADMTVWSMPDGLVRSYAWVGREVPVWGRVAGGAPPYRYDWEFGDGSPRASGTVSDPNHILVPHTYQAAGTYVARLTVTDSSGESAAAVVRLRVVPTPTRREQVNAAIQDGLRYLHLNQNANGSWSAGPYGGGSYVGGTGMAVLAFEEQGYRVRDGGIYADAVQAGLDFIFSMARVVPVDAQSDAYNGNGLGCGFYTNTSGDLRHSYEAGIAMMAIVASGTPEAVIGTGPLAGETYRYAIEEAVDWCAWAQNDSGSARGGWRYTANCGSSDNSVTQWPAIGLEAAETAWGISAPAFVKERLVAWLAYSQNANGGFGYETAWKPNFPLSAGALCAFGYADVPATDARVRKVLDYFRAHWDAVGYDGNKQNMYAMYGFAKGARISEPPIRVLGDLEWQEDYDAYLLGKQRYSLSGGSSWSAEHQYISDSPPHFGTALALLILSPGVFCLPPVADAGPDLEVAPEQPVLLDGSGSYHQDPAGWIVSYEWELGEGGVFGTLRGRTATLLSGFPDRGTEYTVPVTLKVIGSTPDPHCEDVQVAFDGLVVRVVPGIRPLRLSVSSPVETTAIPGGSASWTATVSSEGSPVEGASVPVEDALASRTVVLETDREGRVAYATECAPGTPPATYQILFGPAAKTGYARSSRSVRWVNVGRELSLTIAPQSDQTLRPGQAAEWRARVVASGEPVAGAEVSIVDELQETTRTLVTGPDGSLRYATEVPSYRSPGSYTIAFGPALRSGYRGSGIVTRRVQVSGPLRLLVSDPESSEAVPGSQIGWELLALLGSSPVSGVSVPASDSLTGASESLITDLRGGAAYAITVPLDQGPGEFRATFGPARKAGFEDSDAVERGFRVTPMLQLTVEPLALVVLPGEECAFRLRVTDARGAGIPQAVVSVQDELLGLRRDVMTGDGGRAEYRVRVPDGTLGGEYDVTFAPPRREGYRSVESISTKVHVIGGGALAEVSGSVRDLSTGDGIAGATVRLTDGLNQRTAETDREGRFRFPDVTSGKYTITVTARGFRGDTTRLTVRPKETSASILLRREGGAGKPQVTSVKSAHSSSDGRTIFLDGISLPLDFTIEADWGERQPDAYRFIVWSPNRNPPQSVFEQKSATRQFDVGRDFGPGGRLRAVVVSRGGVASDPVDAGFEVAPSEFTDIGLPITLVPPFSCLYAFQSHGELSYRYDAKLGLPVVDMKETRVPREFPPFGGKGFNCNLYVELESSITTDGALELSITPAPISWELLGGFFQVHCDATLQCVYDESSDVWLFDGGTLAVGVEGSKDFGPHYTVLVLPPPLPPVPAYLRGEVSVALLLRGEVTGFAEGSVTLSAAFAPEFALELAAGLGVYHVLAVEAVGKLEGRLKIDCTGRYPDPLERFRGIWVNGKISVAATIFVWSWTRDLWEFQERCLLGPDCEGAGGLSGGQLPLDLDGFCLLDRGYLRARRAAGGGADGEPGLEVIEPGTFPYPNPRIAALGEELLLVWTRDDGTAEPENRTAIAWRLWDGASWSPPESIDPDGTADFDPQLAVGRREALCAWQDLREPLEPGAGPADAAVRSEVSVASFDPEARAWSHAERLTDDDAYDRSPNLAAAGSRALLVWVKNRSGDLLGGPDAPNAIFYSERGPDGWTNPRVAAEGLSAITKTDLAFDGERAYFIFVEDGDGDAATSDRDLCLLSCESGVWSPVLRLTQDEADDASPRISFLASGEPLLVWHRDGRIEACRNFEVGNSVVVSDAPEAAHAFELALVEGPGEERTILWSGSREGQKDLFACVSSGGVTRWGAAFGITRDDEDERMISGCTLPSGELFATYARVPVPEEEGTWRDLVGRRAPALPDLALAEGEIALGLEGAREGELSLSAVVQNVGLLPAQGAPVQFWLRLPEGDPLMLGASEPFDGPLFPGESVRASIAIAADAPRGTGEVCAVVDAAALLPDADRGNNSACAQVWAPDLVVSGLSPLLLGDGSILVTTTVENVGRVAAPESSVALRSRNPEAELGERPIPRLAPGEMAEVSFSVPLGAAGLRGYDLEAAVDPARSLPEVVRSNNQRTLWVPLGLRGALFLRGDADGNGVVNLSDAVHTLHYLFSGGVSVRCEDAADANDDGTLDVSDPIWLLNCLFLSGPPVPPPFPEPGLDVTPDQLGCESPAS